MIITPERVRHLPQEQRIQPYDAMGGIISRLRAEVPVFLVPGVFDVPHAGHVGFVRAARSLDPRNGIVVVGVESDASVRRNKGGHRPINTAEERVIVLSEYRSTDLVCEFPGVPDYTKPDDYIERYRHLKPTAIVVPTWDPHLDLKREEAERAGTSIVTVIYQFFDNSTTQMLRSWL